MGEVGAVRIYTKLLAARIRADWQYRVSFLLFTFAQATATVLDLLTIAVLFSQVPTLAGWSLHEVLFLYATSAVAFGLADTFASPVERASYHIKHGSFDTFLLRPVGPLVQLCSEEFALRRAGKVVQPAVVLVVAVVHLPVQWTPLRALVVVGTVACATVIFSALWVLTSSLAFWTVDTQEVANAFTYGGGWIAQYPLEVLTGWLRRLTLIIPMAFVNYLPATWLLGRPDRLGVPGWARFLSPVVAALLTAIALSTWRAGVRHYRSTGS